jgi:hypothetical protein
MANVKIEYAASSAVTIGPASLASSSTFVAGRESNSVDNTTNKYLDYLLSGFITVGTTPTASTEIRVYVIGIQDDTTWPDVFDGTDSAETVTSAAILDAIGRLAARMVVDSATSDRKYHFGPISVAALFGGVMPKKFVVYVAHSSVAALNATAGNHVITITPTYETVA